MVGSFGYKFSVISHSLPNPLSSGQETPSIKGRNLGNRVRVYGEEDNRMTLGKWQGLSVIWEQY